MSSCVAAPMEPADPNPELRPPPIPLVRTLSRRWENSIEPDPTRTQQNTIIDYLIKNASIQYIWLVTSTARLTVTWRWRGGHYYSRASVLALACAGLLVHAAGQ